MNGRTKAASAAAGLVLAAVSLSACGGTGAALVEPSDTSSASSGPVEPSDTSSGEPTATPVVPGSPTPSAFSGSASSESPDKSDLVEEVYTTWVNRSGYTLDLKSITKREMQVTLKPGESRVFDHWNNEDDGAYGWREAFYLQSNEGVIYFNVTNPLVGYPQVKWSVGSYEGRQNFSEGESVDFVLAQYGFTVTRNNDDGDHHRFTIEVRNR